MKKPDIKDALYGQLLSTGSAITRKLNWLDQHVGVSGSDLQIPVRWKHIPTNNPDSEWLTFDGRNDSGQILPKNFKAVAELSADKTVVEDLVSLGQVRPAIAYKLGTTMMVGFNDENPNNLFTVSTDTPHRMRIGMRVGRDALQAAIGVYNPVSDVFVTLHDDYSRGEIIPLNDNNQPFV